MLSSARARLQAQALPISRCQSLRTRELSSLMLSFKPPTQSIPIMQPGRTGTAAPPNDHLAPHFPAPASAIALPLHRLLPRMSPKRPLTRGKRLLILMPTRPNATRGRVAAVDPATATANPIIAAQMQKTLSMRPRALQTATFPNARVMSVLSRAVMVVFILAARNVHLP